MAGVHVKWPSLIAFVTTFRGAVLMTRRNGYLIPRTVSCVCVCVCVCVRVTWLIHMYDVTHSFMGWLPLVGSWK